MKGTGITAIAENKVQLDSVSVYDRLKTVPKQ